METKMTMQRSHEREVVLRTHFTEWAKEFDVEPTDAGFADENGNLAYPAHAITEPDGRVWLSTLDAFDASGIRGHVEENPFFRSMLVQAITLPNNPIGSLYLAVNGIIYRVVFQNIKPAGLGKPIINVLFITDPAQQP